MIEAIVRLLKEGSKEVDPMALAAFRTLMETGTVPTATLAAKETVGVVNRTIITLTDFLVTVANSTGASFGSGKIYDFPEGRILVFGVVADLTFNWSGQIADAGSGDFSIGTTASADATLAGTDVDLLPSSPMTDPFVAGVGRGVGALAAAAQFDGTTTAKDAILNIIIDDADVADGDSDVVKVSGTVVIHWIKLGDYAAL